MSPNRSPCQIDHLCIYVSITITVLPFKTFNLSLTFVKKLSDANLSTEAKPCIKIIFRLASYPLASRHLALVYSLSEKTKHEPEVPYKLSFDFYKTTSYIQSVPNCNNQGVRSGMILPIQRQQRHSQSRRPSFCRGLERSNSAIHKAAGLTVPGFAWYYSTISPFHP